MVDRSVGGACMKGRYLMVATGVSVEVVTALKPLHAGMVFVSLLANRKSSQIRSWLVLLDITAVSTSRNAESVTIGGSGFTRG